MAEIWVVNASPLIALGAIGHLDLITVLADEAIVPDLVVAEVTRGRGPRSPGQHWIPVEREDDSPSTRQRHIAGGG